MSEAAFPPKRTGRPVPQVPTWSRSFSLVGKDAGFHRQRRRVPDHVDPNRGVWLVAAASHSTGGALGSFGTPNPKSTKFDTQRIGSQSDAPAARRNPDRYRSRCSGFRQLTTLGTMSGVIERSRAMVLRAS